MKVLETKLVLQAVQANLNSFILTQGKAEIVGTDLFTEEMLDKFDLLLDQAITRYLEVLEDM